MGLFPTILFCFLVVACSPRSGRPHKFKNERALASEDPSLFKELRKKAGQCYAEKRKACYQSYPYNDVKKGWFEFEYQRLNRANQLHAYYNECTMRNSIWCSNRFGLYEDAERMEELRRNSNNYKLAEEARNNTLWNNIKKSYSIELPVKAIQTVFNFVLTLKKVYRYFVDNVVKDVAAFSKKGLNLFHGFGVSGSGTLLLGAGGTIQYEAVMHKRKLALFCAPGIVAKTDAGVGADIGVLKTIGCVDNKDYAGKFLTVDLGVSFEYAGLPASIGGSYSLGMDVSGFLKEMRDHKVAGRFKWDLMVKELDDIALKGPDIFGEIYNTRESILMQYLLVKMVAEIFGQSETSRKMDQLINAHWEKEFKGKVWNIKSMGQHLSQAAARLHQMEKDYGWNLPMFAIVTKELSKSISSCDSISAHVGISGTISPVSIGVILYQYDMVTEVSMDDILYLAGFAPKNLARMSLPKSERDKFVSTFIRVLKVIPDLANNRCIYEAGLKFYTDFGNMMEIIQ